MSLKQKRNNIQLKLSYSGKEGIYDIIRDYINKEDTSRIEVKLNTTFNGIESQSYNRVTGKIDGFKSSSSSTNQSRFTATISPEIYRKDDKNDTIIKIIPKEDLTQNLYNIQLDELKVSILEYTNISNRYITSFLIDNLSRDQRNLRFIITKPIRQDIKQDGEITYNIFDPTSNERIQLTQTIESIYEQTEDIDDCAIYQNQTPPILIPDERETITCGGVTYIWNSFLQKWVEDDELDPGGEPEIPGCTDQRATNYNANATKDDGSCEYRNFATQLQTIKRNVEKGIKRGLINNLIESEFDVTGIEFNLSEEDRYFKYSIIDSSGSISPIINWVRGGDLQQVSTEIDILDSVVAKLPNPLPSTIQRLDVVDIFNTPYLPIEIGVDLSEDEGRVGVLQLTPNFRTDLEDNLINNFSDYKNFNSLTLSGSQDIQKNVIDYYLQQEKGKIKLNTDFTDFQNFIKFSSAEERINNFFYKVQLLETYTSQSAVVSSSTASPIYKSSELERLDDNIRLVKNSFDDYEYFLYNDSGSFYSSSFVSPSDGIFASWPKLSGEETLVNGDFASSVSWSLNGGAQLVDETLLLEDSSTVTQSLNLSSGVEYTLSFDAFSGKQVLNITYNSIPIIGNKNLIKGGSASNPKKHSFRFIAQDGDLSDTLIILSSLGDAELKLDNISIKPKPSLLSSNSTEVRSWYNGLVQIAADYDNRNRDSFRNNTPEYIREDEDSSDYVLFVDMIGQLFDEIWLYTKELGNLYDWNNDITRGLSEDLSLVLLNMYSNNLDTGFSEKDIWEYILGLDANIAEVGGLQTNFSFDRQQKQTIRRLLTNLPHLLKHKGTRRAIEGLVRSYGIPESTLFIKEFGSLQSPDGIEQQSKKRVSTYYLDFDGGGNNYLTLNDGSISQSRAIEFNLAFDTTTPSTQTFFHATGSTPSGYFTIGIEHTSGQSGKLVLDIVSGSDTFQLSSSALPLYVDFDNGNFWNILVQKTDDADYEIRLNQFDRTDGEFNYQIVNQSTVPSNISAGIDTVFEDIDEFHFGEYSTLSLDFEGKLDELRIWGTSLTGDNFDEHTKYPQSIKLNNALTIPSELKVRVDIENEWTTTTGGSPGYLPNLVFNPTYPTQVSTVGFTQENWINYTRTDYFTAPNVGDTKLSDNKVRYDITQTLNGNALTPNVDSNETNERITEVNDVNELIIGFSPTDILNQIIIQHFGNTDLVNEYGNPLETYNDRYDDLSNLVENFFSNIESNQKAKFFIQYIRNFDKTLLNNIKKFVPEKANLTTGIFIEPHYLDRSKAPRLSKAETVNLANEGAELPPQYSTSTGDPDRTSDPPTETGDQTFDNTDDPVEALPELSELERFLGEYFSIDLDENGQANVILSTDEIGQFLNQNTNVIILGNSFFDDIVLYNDFDADGVISVRNDRNEKFKFEIRKFDYDAELAELMDILSQIDEIDRNSSNDVYTEITEKYETLNKVNGHFFLIKYPYSIEEDKPGVKVSPEDRTNSIEYLLGLGILANGTINTNELEIDGVIYFTDDSGTGGSTDLEEINIRRRIIATNPDQDIKLTVE